MTTAVGELDQTALLKVLTEFKRGNFAVRMPDDWTGTAGKIADALNDVIEANQRLGRELARVGRLVGEEGRISQRATMPALGGEWAQSVDSVNELIENLVRPTSEMARVIGAVAGGDLTQTVATEIDGRPVKGVFLQTAKTVNTMVQQLNGFASEVTRVAREVGIEGKLGGQAQVRGVGGTWKDLTDNVNLMAGNLTSQVRNIAEVTTAVANGDLSKKITVEGQGEILELKNTINTMVDQLNAFASEVTRVAREVGTEGKLGGQADVKGVGGTWKDLTDNVNLMAGQLTNQIRNIADVTTAVATGDLSKKITVDVKGEILELKNTINTMVDQLNAFASEVTRVAREVGTEGKLGGQADVKDVGGTWKDLTDNVNLMAGQLTNQIRNIADVTTALANGDLSKKITVEGQGEILELKNTINTMLDQLNGFASEVTRVAREVGTEGKLGGQADVQDVGGTWKDLTDNVNLMAGNLTGQVRNIAEVTTAVANGDLSKKITVEGRGEILELKNTINTMVDQLNAFAGEVTRVAREVGTEGKLGGQADVRDVGGVWKDLTDNVNLMAGNLTSQVRNIADVTTALANGDLSKKITVDVKGEILELKNTINTMLDQLNGFASEVTRVAREVGTEGKLGGQAQVKDVGGTWKDLTDNVNTMAGNLTSQVRNIAEVTTAVANGDISKKITVEGQGEILELKNTINTMVDQLNAFASEVTRVAREVGTEGKLGGQAQVKGVGGVWKDLTDNVNLMAGQLTEQVRGIARVVTAVANGDLSKKITVDAQGEIAELKDTTNTMVDQLNAFASEVTRVAREVGTEGKLGGQAQVRGVAGTWKDLTDNVNLMAANLTEQVRGIARVVTAVANGDLKRKLAVEAKGEVAELGATINEMTDTLAIFADQVTTVAREVGVEGKLGGQASVPGASGTWKDLTDNVNQLAANLTTQLRAIADVATSVTEGDLNREIGVEASGEVAVVKDKINQMIVNLAATTRKNAEQDWLKTNLARFTRVLQGQRDLMTVSKMILSELAPLVNAQHGVFYTMDSSNAEEPVLKFQAGYAYKERKHLATVYRVGEGLVGQCALEKERILLTGVPDDYIKINSALGESSPLSIIVLPVLFEGQVRAVIELASFDRFSDIHQDFLDQLTESIGIVLNTIEANMTTESLLKQSQSLAHELQSQQEELQKTNEELEQKARLLAEQNTEVERKNLEVEQAKRSLEEKAEQLEITSRYKNEFLANMSHELRTPLNSLLILAQQLTDNPDGNLTDKQVDFARIIRSSGQDLLALINDILDLSKIESGTVALEIAEEPMAGIVDFVERTFRHVAESKKLQFSIELGENLPDRMRTDPKRLQQVLRNLLSNSFKFTEQGRVGLRINLARGGWSADRASLNTASGVISFEVSDTGIGIAREKHRHIFEAFQQADGSTARRFGGTGLGLTISRQLVTLLGGEIKLESEVGQGSTFTVYLPVKPGRTRPEGRRSAAARDITEAGVGAIERAVTDGLFRPGLNQVEELPEGIEDDRATVTPADRTVLILEDDPNFATVLLDLAHQNGFKGLIALHGETALLLARQFRPSAITLDLGLRDMSGWAVLDRLKQDPETSGIPVHIISVFEDGAERGLSGGASTYLTKPVGKETLEGLFARIEAFISTGGRKLLVVEDDPIQRQHIVETVSQGDVEAVAVGTGKEALEILRTSHVDCVVLDLGLPDIDGHKLIDQIHRLPGQKQLPIIIYTAAELSVNSQARLKKTAKMVIQKSADSAGELAKEVNGFFARVREQRPATTALAEPFRPLEVPDVELGSRRALVVDDDVRNIFALTALLERQGMEILHAESGREAIQLLHENPSIEVVLMDIMMPGMDGYETMSAIRRIDGFENLPIIALTAKAMKGDREKCLEAGASDYIAKPVDPEHLLGLLRSWLHS
ncbi:MAG TPA: HAMP domain-containing protein [Candidatus Dormibacteraeota bacterium]|nr:HAMP domain-containing protein [Candidatus Dormibacteraeota bacterium]